MSPRGVKIPVKQHLLVGDDGRRVGDAVLERHFDDFVHPAFPDIVPVAGTVDERVALERLQRRHAEEMLHLGDARVLIRNS